jgi:hypothetical protein
MRVLVCGGRDYSDEKKVFETLDKVKDKYGDDVIIIHGACSGADDLAEKWAKDREVEYMGFPAKWKKQNRAAGPIRNKRMRDVSIPDACIAFGGSDGTKGMCKLMEDIGLTPWVLP